MLKINSQLVFMSRQDRQISERVRDEFASMRNHSLCISIICDVSRKQHQQNYFVNKNRHLKWLLVMKMRAYTEGKFAYLIFISVNVYFWGVIFLMASFIGVEMRNVQTLNAIFISTPPLSSSLLRANLYIFFSYLDLIAKLWE